MEDDIDFGNADLDAILGGEVEGESSQEVTETPETTTPDETPATETVETVETPSVETQESTGPGDLKVALKQERQARQELAAQYQELQRQQAELNAYIQEQRELAEQQAAIDAMPDPITDPEGFRKWEIQQATLPYQRQVQEAQRAVEAQQRNTAILELESKYPGATSLIQQVAALPGMDALPPTVQYFAGLGAQLADPTAREALIKPYVDAALKAAVKAAPPKTPPSTQLLTGLPSGTAAKVDPNNITKTDFDKHGWDLLDMLP